MEQFPQRESVPQIGVSHTPRLWNGNHHSEEPASEPRAGPRCTVGVLETCGCAPTGIQSLHRQDNDSGLSPAGHPLGDTGRSSVDQDAGAVLGVLRGPFGRGHHRDQPVPEAAVSSPTRRMMRLGISATNR